MSLTFLLVATLVLIVVLAQTLKIADESERFAVFVLGRFMDFRGPGLVLVTPYTQKVIRLKVGDIGRVNGPDFVTFGKHDIPVGGLSSFRVGQSVRIDRFDGATPVLSASSIAPTSTCPKCGHSF